MNSYQRRINGLSLESINELSLERGLSPKLATPPLHYEGYFMTVILRHNKSILLLETKCGLVGFLVKVALSDWFQSLRGTSASC